MELWTIAFNTVIGTQSFQEQFIKNKVQGWVKDF